MNMFKCNVTAAHGFMTHEVYEETDSKARLASLSSTVSLQRASYCQLQRLSRCGDHGQERRKDHRQSLRKMRHVCGQVENDDA